MSTTRHKKLSFTLIEMLVVMVIILVLAGLLLPVVQMAKTSADQARAKESINQMAAAFRAYMVEFSCWPTPPSAVITNLAIPCPSSSVDFLITTNLFANSSGITFYDFSTKDVVSNAVYNGLIVDPWKSPYFCRLDTSYTGSVSDPFYNTATHLLPVGYAIWSLGNDGTMIQNASGDNALLNKDNPKSW